MKEDLRFRTGGYVLIYSHFWAFASSGKLGREIRPGPARHFGKWHQPPDCLIQNVDRSNSWVLLFLHFLYNYL